MRSRISDKVADLERYQGDYDECWLLVYSTLRPSTRFDHQVLTPDMFTSRFDGVAWVDLFTGNHRISARGRVGGANQNRPA